MVKYKTSPQLSPLTGKLIIPGDKSVSHRALLLAAIAEGDTYIKNLCDGADVASTRHALEQLGIIIRDIAPHQIQVQGQGLLGLKKAPVALDLGNSGTTMRLLPGILVNQSFASTLIGDISLLKRPMQRVIDPLRAVGAQINSMNNGCAPLHIEPITQALQPIDYVLPLASAQVKSCLLLAGLYTAGRSKITEKISTRDHTERLFKQFNIPLYHSQTKWRTLASFSRLREKVLEGRMRASTLEIAPTSFKALPELVIPSDTSSAAFFIAAATLIPDSSLLLQDIMVNPSRMGFIKVLKKMGAQIEIIPKNILNCPEPIADIHVTHAKLRGITIDPNDIVAMIDEFPIFFVVAACSAGTTEVHGVEELRYKESDRLNVMAQALKILNIQVLEFSDGLRIQGGKLQGGIVTSDGDHRIAMALSVAGLCASDQLFIEECDNVATSFPRFIEIAQEVGMSLSKHGD